MRVTRNHTLSFAQPAADLFPLFTPIKEKYWAHGWSPTLIYSDHPTAEEKGAVFTIQHPNAQTAVWVVAHYDPAAYRVEYAQVLPELYVAWIAVQCMGETSAAVQVTYTVTALSEAGKSYIASNFSEEQFYHHRMPAWQQAIDYYLQTGQQMNM